MSMIAVASPWNSNSKLTFARSSYALLVFASAAAALYGTVVFVMTLSQQRSLRYDVGADAYSMLLLAAFLVPSGKAIVRIFRRGPLLDRVAVGARPFFWIVVIASAIGNLFAVVSASVIVEILQRRLADVSGIGFLISLAAIFYLIALWIGEFVLMRDWSRRSTEAR